MALSKISQQERRKYKRIDTIFPVEFQILDDNNSPQSNWLQAFSQDISRGGLCLTANNLLEEDTGKFVAQKTTLLLQIHSPFSDRSFLAYSKIAWFRKSVNHNLNQHIFGIYFTKIDSKEINRLLNYAIFKKVLWRGIQFLILGILFFTALTIRNNFRIQAQNLAVLDGYTKLVQKDLKIMDDYKRLLDERDKFNKQANDNLIQAEILKESINKIELSKVEEVKSLEEKLLQARNQDIKTEEEVKSIKDLNLKLEDFKKIKDEEIAKLEKEVEALKENDKNIKNNLLEVIAKEEDVKEALTLAEEERKDLSGELRSKLYDWLVNHQNRRTGLIVSFEGDYNLKDVSYTYDQALAIISYALFGEQSKAKKVLSFYLNKAQKAKSGGYYNAYYSNNGDSAEFIAHAGPNLWLGLAVLQYTYKTKDYAYIKIAEEVANWIISLQDKEFGIPGGEAITWYSTEHNLDAYAFFNMFYELTSDKKYKDSAETVLAWLSKYAYNNSSIPINRGKGDSTIATDTYAWSIAALGPRLLKESSMNPDEIITFAKENSAVTVEYIDRFGKQINVSGFDFAKPEHTARGGIISCEWTAQMVLSFNIMSDYYKAQGDANKSMGYHNEALKYLGELNKMIISSSSAFGQGEWCLPYSSHENADTGHGWRTPQGKKTGSVAATAYTIFALSDFNPLRLSK